MDKLEKPITNYLKKDNTDYALMITGSWGIGKTFFWKQYIKSEIKKINKKSLYISVYGIKSIDELNRKLVLKLTNIQTKKESKSSGITKIFDNFKEVVGKFAKAQFNIDIGIIIDFFSLDDFVICFDDLERSEFKNINHLFGYISLFIEHKNAKTILITNEDELINKYIQINEKSNKNNKKLKKEKYFKEKDKLIRYTFNYEPDIKKVILEIINDCFIDNGYIIFLKKNIDLIEISVEKCEMTNFRILKQAIIDFFEIYTFYKKNNGKYSNVTLDDLKNILYYTISLSFVLKFKITEKYSVVDNNFESLLYQCWDKGLSEYYKNLNIRIKYKLYISVTFFVFKGYLDYDLLNKDFDELQNLNSVEKLHFNNLDYYWMLNDKEFDEAINYVYNVIQEGKLLFAEYPKYFDKFNVFVDKGLIEKTKDKLFENFMEGLKKAFKNAKYIQFIEEYFVFERDNISGDYKKIKEYIIKENEELFLKQINKKINDIIDRLPDSIDELISFLIYDYINFSIFNFIDINKLYKKLLLIDNNKIISFSSALQKRYEYPDNQFKDEIKTLEELNRKVNNFSGEKIKKSNLKHLSTNLEELFNKNRI